MIEHNMIDAVVATGANIVDQDFFEALGHRHFQGTAEADDQELRKLAVDRIYDTYIDEEQLRVCDDTVLQIARMDKGFLMLREHDGRFRLRVARSIKGKNVAEEQFKVAEDINQNVSNINEMGRQNADEISAWTRGPSHIITLNKADHLLSNKHDAVFVANEIAEWFNKL